MEHACKILYLKQVEHACKIVYLHQKEYSHVRFSIFQIGWRGFGREYINSSSWGWQLLNTLYPIFIVLMLFYTYFYSRLVGEALVESISTAAAVAGNYSTHSTRYSLFSCCSIHIFIPDWLARLWSRVYQQQQLGLATTQHALPDIHCSHVVLYIYLFQIGWRGFGREYINSSSWGWQLLNTLYPIFIVLMLFYTYFYSRLVGEALVESISTAAAVAGNYSTHSTRYSLFSCCSIHIFIPDWLARLWSRVYQQQQLGLATTQHALPDIHCSHVVLYIYLFQIGWRGFGREYINSSSWGWQLLNTLYPIFIVLMLFYTYIYEIIACQWKLNIQKDTQVGYFIHSTH